VHLENGSAVVLSDTVGFIRHLPHTLVAAFRATLEETARADLLLHVVDASSATRDAQIAAVNEVLAEIGAERIPQVLVYNKIDLTRFPARVERDQYGRIARAWISARSGEGLSLVRLALEEYASGTISSEDTTSPAAA
jgi:GTP-binding protein HflX